MNNWGLVFFCMDWPLHISPVSLFPFRCSAAVTGERVKLYTGERESVRTLFPFPPLVSPRSFFLREFFSRALLRLLSERLEQARARLTGLARFPRSRLTSKSFVKFLMSLCERAGWLGSRDRGWRNRDLGKRDAANGIALHSLSRLLKNTM